MHRVNNRPKRTVALRVIAYGVTIVLSAITTVVLLFVALGYQFDSSGEVVKSGLVLVDNKPEAAQIYIDGELKDNQSPGRFVLPIGDYELSLELNGYTGWKKNYTVTAQSVEQVTYPLLIPEKLQSNGLTAITRPTALTQTPDNKTLLLYTSGQPLMTRLILDTESPKQTTANLSAAFTRQAGSLGQLEFANWSLNSKRVLIKHSLPNGAIEYILYNPEKPQEAINISRVFQSVAPEQPQFVGNETSVIYGINQGVLRRYDLQSNKSEVVLERVYSYVPYGDETIAFTRQSEDTLAVEVGVYKNETTAILERVADATVRPIIDYGEYDDHAFLAISNSVAGKTTLYRDPLKRPILQKQIPFTTLPTAEVSSIQFSPGNQYIAVQSGDTFTSFDFENNRVSTFVIEGEVVGTALRWMNPAHLSYQLANGANFLIEFDGQNKKELLPSDVGSRIFFSNNERNAFRIVSSEISTVLELVPLTVE